MGDFRPQDYEQKWRRKWEEEGVAQVDLNSEQQKAYILDMFPYPSGDGLHVGHWRGYVLSDVIARVEMMSGKAVLHPMGFDAFGLPAENFALKTGVHPRVSTQKAIENFKRQLASLGANYDWEKEVVTSDPEYYRWTQWLFLQFYGRGLAYRAQAPVNWCGSCQTVLANEQVVDGVCERCDTVVVKKNLRQWFFKITEYADRLVDDLVDLRWPNKVKLMQKNWIGRREGARVSFELVAGSGGVKMIEVFTTRVDTLFGCSYVVLAPEYTDLVQFELKNRVELEDYQLVARAKTEIDRTRVGEQKTGVLLEGVRVKNPLNGDILPVFVADYVLAGFGTGAVMAVPQHDQRDWDFAQKYDLPVTRVIEGGDDGEPFVGKGRLINSGEYDGLQSVEAAEKIIITLTKLQRGGATKSYRLRDWLISRQRYWGCPIPILYCDKCGVVPERAENLPVVLPDDIVDWQPQGGKSPLASVPSFVNAKCPQCGGAAQRETDTMDTFVDSSWYFLRYAGGSSNQQAFDPDLIDRWLGVDFYVGGVEHAVLHLLYARFFNKVCFDLGLTTHSEPFDRLFNQGMIYLNGAKMSKSKGNVISPDDIIKQYGTDCMRAYQLFIGPPEQDAEWNERGIAGVYRFLGRFWHLLELVNNDKSTPEVLRKIHQSITKARQNMETLQLNTTVAILMEVVNTIYKEGSLTQTELELLIRLIAPITPHLAEEMWSKLGYHASIFKQSWPEANPALIIAEELQLVVQVNGKVRGKFQASLGISKDQAFERARGLKRVQEYLEDREVLREIWVPNKIVGFVI